MNPDPTNTPLDILQQRNRELSILNTIAESLNRSVEIEEILRETLAQVAELLSLKTGWIWLIRSESDETILAASQNLPPALRDYPERMDGSCYCIDTFQEGDMEGAANLNVIRCSRLRWLTEGTEGLRYHASIPLYAHGKKLGVFNVARSGWKELSQEDLRLLYTVGDMVSIAIERARLFAQSMQLGVVEERNRLAREIHDTLAQELTGISLQLETADALLEAGVDHQKIHNTIKHTLRLVRVSLDEARRSVLDLRAGPLEDRTLSEALTALAGDFRQKWNIHVIFSATGENQPLPSQVEVGLYRIAQEALNNVQKHAEAKNVVLRLATSSDTINLTITDDGLGFNPEQIPEGRFGLVGINERAKLLGGNFHLQSNPGNGTKLSVKAPL
jgi:two-component system NarL family sensor kinase